MKTKEATPKGARATTSEKNQEQPSLAAPETQTKDDSKELRAEIERLKQQIASGPTSIEEKIKYYQKKQEQIQRLQSLTESGEVIRTHVESINHEAEEDVFISEKYKLVLTSKSGYSSESELIKFKNPVIISELLSFVLDKIEGKRLQIETEINK